MAVQLTIIGMGQVGTSIGLALAAYPEKIRRTGHDKDFEQANKAQRLGALDKAEMNLPRSVEGADLVILSLPLDAIQETLTLIAPDLRPGCVVMDTAPFKAPVSEWARTQLGPDRHYIGLVPALSPHHIAEMERPPHADLFRAGLVGLVSPAGTPAEALQLACDLITLLGAEPFFLDLIESDGLMASAHILPQLISASLLNLTVDSPGWLEVRRLAGRPYATVALPAASQDSPASLAQALVANPQASLGALDGYIQTLNTLRAAIAAGDEDHLTRRFKQARLGRNQWWLERASGDWRKVEADAKELPKRPGLFGSLLGLDRRK